MLATRSVLLVEDDEVIRDMLKEQLADDHGFIVFTAPTLEAADKIIDAKNSSVDAVILDRGLPDGDGCDYCMKLRRHGHNMPVIMLTGMDGEEDVVRGLEFWCRRLYRQALPYQRTARAASRPTARI